jgi:hypothetical protein
MVRAPLDRCPRSDIRRTTDAEMISKTPKRRRFRTNLI